MNAKKISKILSEERKESAHKTHKRPAAKKAKGKAKQVDKVAKVMREFSKNALHSGSKKGPKVKSKAQALAIGYAEKRKAAKKKK